MDESVISDAADAKVKAKDFEISFMLLGQACSLYSHVKRYGIDRTFLSIYNANGELDRLCGIQFPSCEVFSTKGDRYSRYTAVFLAAMEGYNVSLWQRVKTKIKEFWEWIVGGLANLMLKLYRKAAMWLNNIDKLVKRIESKYDTSQEVKLPRKYSIAWMAADSARSKGNVLSEIMNNVKMKANCGKDLAKDLNDLADIVKTAINTKEQSADITARLLEIDTNIKNDGDMVGQYTNKGVKVYPPGDDGVTVVLRTLLVEATVFSTSVKEAFKEHDEMDKDTKSAVKNLKDAIYKIIDAEDGYYANDTSLPQKVLHGLKIADSLLNMSFGDNTYIIKLASDIYTELYEVSRTLSAKA